MFPYAVAKDAVGLFAFLILFAWFVFFLPDYLGHADNYIEANPLVTPPHIVPEWYFLPFYAILRAIPSKLGGVIAMFSAIVDPGVRAVARYQPRALGEVPADLQVVLLAVRLLVPGARLSRRQAAGGRLRLLGARLHVLLFRPLPAGDADRRHDRDADRAAASRSRRRCCGTCGWRLRRRRAAAAAQRSAERGTPHDETDKRFILSALACSRRRCSSPPRRLVAEEADTRTSSARRGASAASPASTTRRSCSAAFRSTRTSARPATA